ncbi:MAG: hypothetical protein H7231_12900 [Rhodoferax sp.]|nr:hypothetical protein [Actinomycetota bacterium]
MVPSPLDTWVGIAAGVALAAALPELPYACGLGTAALFARDVADPPLQPTGGGIEVARALATSLDPGRLADLAAPADRQRWWRDRLERCAALLP